MFFSTLFSTLIKMAVLAATAVAGILAGKKLRDNKKQRDEEISQLYVQTGKELRGSQDGK